MRKPRKSPWTLEEAQALLLRLRRRLPGYALGLTGSVLVKGSSKHDLDLIIYPRTTAKQNIERVRSALVRAGLRLRLNHHFVKLMWKRQGSNDTKRVEVWEYEGKRIDIFFLS